MVKNCGNCVHWSIPGDYKHSNIINPVDPDTFEPMKIDFDVKVCTNPDILFWERPVSANGASLVDGSEYKADLVTGPEFSCALHTLER